MHHPVEERDASSRGPTVGREPPCVLVVEDDPEFAELVRFELETGGYTVEIASSVGEARRRMREGGALDLILSDVRLPGPSGVELLFAESSGAARPPVLMMSAFVSTELRDFVEGTGTTVLEKPFPLEHLHASVLRILMQGAHEKTDMHQTVLP